ncbi:MAG: hypothetical protein JKX81_06490 [Arenicella sp.]|nr:hypothetical protein [Arenicella sp.]
MNKLLIKITFAALLLIAILWILFPRDSTESEVGDNDETSSADLVSAIQPIPGAIFRTPGITPSPIDFRDGGVKVNSLSSDELELLTSRFDEANSAIDQGNTQAGLEGLEALILDYPSVIEPYLNVASIYAEQQDLERARATLLSGFSANPKAGMLFDHLKKVHGALAANSYRQALDTNSPTPANAKLVLARVSSILTQLDQSNQIVALQKTLQESQNQFAESTDQLQDKKVAALESRLNDLEERSAMAKSVYELELSDLKIQIDEQSQALSLSQTAEREALNQIAEVTEQLESQKALVVAVRALSRGPAAQVASTDESVISSASLMQETHRQNAIGLVQSWAKAWSEQDVSAYVGYYDESYSSSRSLSRAQWLEQRQARLTNKSFISVEVSSFEVEDMGSRFSVTFLQYYQSNTVDERVTKRLLFNKSGDDWSQSKILKEQLVSAWPEW